MIIFNSQYVLLKFGREFSHIFKLVWKSLVIPECLQNRLCSNRAKVMVATRIVISVTISLFCYTEQGMQGDSYDFSTM